MGIQTTLFVKKKIGKCSVKGCHLVLVLIVCGLTNITEGNNNFKGLRWLNTVFQGQ